MRMTTKLALLTSIALGLSACGGGGGSSSSAPLSYTFNDGTTITNTGTGQKAEANLTVAQAQALNQSANSGESLAKFYSDVEQAHREGWTGQNTKIVANHNGWAEIIAPNATHRTWTNSNLSHACVSKDVASTYCDDENGITVGVDRELSILHHSDQRQLSSNANVAAGAAIVWSKFINLNDDHIEHIIESTADNNVFRLDRALSPVGNLN